MRPIPSLLALAAMLLPVGAAAHSVLRTSVPEAGAVVAGPVTEISLAFADGMRLTRVEVEGADGPVQLEIAEPAGTEFVLPAELAAGAYELRWIGLAADGHPTKGVFAFEVE